MFPMKAKTTTVALAWLALTACGGIADYKPDTGTPSTPPGQVDADHDGHTADSDCNDLDANVYPGAPELCNNQDDDCDGVIPSTEWIDNDHDGVVECEDCDDQDPSLFESQTFWVDRDEDGYGDPNHEIVACEQPDGAVDNADDCDDDNPEAQPGTVWYRDRDGDGYGNLDDALTQCDQPDGYVLDNTDCDDNDPDVYPGQIWYEDADGDGYGNASHVVISCDPGSGYVTDDSDCDDSDPTVFPGQQWSPDSDGDTYGDMDDIQVSCGPPAVGYVPDHTDCDDADPLIYPGATERCNGLDDDCDGALWADEVDGDGDGYSVCDGDPDDTDAGVVPEPCFDIEDFESGVWPAAGWTVVSSGGSVTGAAAHDGSYGVFNPDWHYRSDVTVGLPGDLYGAWVRFHNSGRAYIGFDAAGSGAKSLVLGMNTGELMFQENVSYSYTDVATVGYAFNNNTWYYGEVEFLGGTSVVGRLYDSSGLLITSVSHTFGSLSASGVALRSFNDTDIDTLGFCQ